MKRVLILGGAGYLGSVLCRKLLENGYHVTVLDSLLYGDEGINDLYKNDNFKLIVGDIRNLEKLIKSIQKIDYVVHLAAVVGDEACALNPVESHEINQLSIESIIYVCKMHKIKRFIFASSCSVYGASDGLLTETSKVNPISLYAKTKLNTEDILLNEKDENFSPIILRFGTLFGVSKRMRFDLVINYFTMTALNENLVSFSGGEQERCFCHVDDVSDAILKCLEVPLDSINGQIFNVSSINMKIFDLAHLIREEIPNAKILENNTAKDKRSYITSNEKLIKCTNWKPTHTIEDFVNEMKIQSHKWNDFKSPKYNNYLFLKEKQLEELG